MAAPGITPISTNFSVRIASALDPRLTVADRATMLALDWKYGGMLVTVLDDDGNGTRKTYRLDTFPGGAIIGDWTELGAGAPTEVAIGTPITGGTANRVLYVDSSGNLADSANLTFSGTQLGLANGTVTAPSLQFGGAQSGLFRSTGVGIERLQASLDGSEAMRLYRDTVGGFNRAGINLTTDPTAAFQVKGNANESITVFSNSASGNSWQILENGKIAVNDPADTNEFWNIDYDSGGLNTYLGIYRFRHYGLRPVFRLENARGTKAAPLPLNIGDIIGQIDASGFRSDTDSFAGSGAQIGFIVNSDYSSNLNRGATLYLQGSGVNSQGTRNNRILIGRNIFIGSADATPVGAKDNDVAVHIAPINSALTPIDFEIDSAFTGNPAFTIDKWGTVLIGYIPNNYTPSTANSGLFGGHGNILVGDSSNVPNSNPTGAFLMYSEGGNAYFRNNTGNLLNLTNSAWNTTGVGITRTILSAGNGIEVARFYRDTVGGLNRVGMNLTTDPVAALHVRGNGTGTGELIRATDSGGTRRVLLQDNGVFVVGNSLVSTSLFQVNGNVNAPIDAEVVNYSNGSNSRSGLRVGEAGVGFLIAAYQSAYTTVPEFTNKGVLHADSGLTGGLLFRTEAGPIVFAPETVERFRIEGNNFGFNTTNQFGTGSGVIGIANAATVPSTDPVGGGVLFVEGGALKYRGSSGTVTTIAVA